MNLNILQNTQALIADTQAIAVAGVSKLLVDMGHPMPIEQVQSANELFAALEHQRYDLLIIDYLQLPGFDIESFQQLAHVQPQLKVMVITADSNLENILKIVDSEVPAFLTKQCSVDEIKMAYHALVKGEKFFCDKILNILVKSRSHSLPKHKPNLSQREMEITKLIALGNSTASIAHLLNISPHTVSTHRKNIIKKLGIQSPTQFVVHAMELGLVAFESQGY